MNCRIKRDNSGGCRLLNARQLTRPAILNIFYTFSFYFMHLSQRLYWLCTWSISTSQKLLNGLWSNYTGRKLSFTKSVLFEPIHQQNGCPCFWFAETFFTVSLQPLNRLTKPDKNQALNILYHFVFSGRSVNKDDHPALRLAKTFCYFSSTTAEGIWTIFWRKQVLNIF